MDSLIVPCPGCGKNVLFAPEKRAEPATCRACGFQFIPSAPDSINPSYTPLPMGPRKPPLHHDPTDSLHRPHGGFWLGCPLEVWLVIAVLALNAFVSVENCVRRTVVDGPLAEPNLMEKFYGPTLAGWVNVMAAAGVIDVVLGFGLFNRRDWAFFATMFRSGGGTLLAAGMLLVGDYAPIGVAFPVLMMILSLSRAGGRF